MPDAGLPRVADAARLQHVSYTRCSYYTFYPTCCAVGLYVSEPSLGQPAGSNKLLTFVRRNQVLHI